MEPFGSQLDLETGVIHGAQIVRRTLSDMRTMFADRAAVERILAEEGDRLIYEVHAVPLPEEAGQVLHSTTIIYPGQIGGEYHMTKGHFHQVRARAEVYVGLAGEGCLVLQTEDGEVVRGMPMQRGTIAYVPPLWAHRTVNTGATPFAFLAAWPGDSGHDYGAIEQTGFARLLVDRDGRPAFVDNPHWRR